MLLGAIHVSHMQHQGGLADCCDDNLGMSAAEQTTSGCVHTISNLLHITASHAVPAAIMALQWWHSLDTQSPATLPLLAQPPAKATGIAAMAAIGDVKSLSAATGICYSPVVGGCHRTWRQHVAPPEALWQLLLLSWPAWRLHVAADAAHPLT